MNRRWLMAAFLTMLGAVAAISPAASAPEVQPTYFVLLHTPGPKWRSDLPVFQQPGIADHGRYLGGLKASGALVMAGPFLDNSGGMAILEAASLEEASRIANDDPAVKAGLLRVTVRPWLVGLRREATATAAAP